jgi:transposase
VICQPSGSGLLRSQPAARKMVSWCPVGLYLNPPQNAVVVCVDEKSQCQALERAQPILPMRPGIPERHTHDYARHGVTSLFAALNTATGQVTDACYPRHRHQEFLRFLKKVATAYPGTELHVVCDNYATHKHPQVKAWLEKNPRISLHFTPTGCSWLNLVECFFSIITRQAIDAAPSPQSRTSSPRSARSPAIGTTTPGRSPGPRTQTRSSAKSGARRLKPTLLQSTSRHRNTSSEQLLPILARHRVTPFGHRPPVSGPVLRLAMDSRPVSAYQDTASIPAAIPPKRPREYKAQCHTAPEPSGAAADSVAPPGRANQDELVETG